MTTISNSLIEKAKQVDPVIPKGIKDEDIELALAWVMGIVTLKGVEKAYGVSNYKASTKIMNSLKTYILKNEPKL